MLKNFRTYHLAVQLYHACEKVQARSHLKDQLLRASLSIVLNLSEGSAKPTEKDRMALLRHRPWILSRDPVLAPDSETGGSSSSSPTKSEAASTE